MKIAIEAQRIFRKEKHGMDYVALETIREIQKIDRQNEYFILVSPGEDRCLQESDNMHIVQIDYPSYPLWEQIGLPSTLKKIQPDLLHCTGNTPNNRMLFFDSVVEIRIFAMLLVSYPTDTNPA